MGDRVAAHRDDFKPKYKGQDCAGCVFLGRYTYQAPFNTGPRKTTVDLYVCLGQVDPSLIARFGSAPSKYSSHPIDNSIEEWLSSWMKNSGVKPTYFDAMREAWRRALVLGLVKGKKWDSEGIDWSDGNRLQLELKVRVKVPEHLESLVPLAKEYADELVRYALQYGKSSSRALGSSLGSISACMDVAPGQAPPSPNQPPIPPPLDPLAFLGTLAADALERAERLEKRATTMFAGDADEEREVAARYRLRAETYKTAALEMKLEMEKRGRGRT